MKVYIVSPYHKTGGPRSLHQLGKKLLNKGLDVYIVYGNQSKIYNNINKPLYEDMKIDLAYKIDDDYDNVLIVPESDTSWLLRFKKIRKVVWWLSLDNYLNNNLWWHCQRKTVLLRQPKIVGDARYIFRKIKGYNVKYIKTDEEFSKIYHLYNCEYVRDYLLKKNVKYKNMQYLCGPIDIRILDKNKLMAGKKNIVVYNPAKMDKFILKKIKKYMKKNYPNYNFIPIENMDHKEVLQWLRKAKIYIDFGYFPGPERMPREAVMEYCNIITSKRGSAKNKIDVPIPEKYKFDLERKNVREICKLIVDMSENFSAYSSDFDNYRKKVKLQINNFDVDINKFYDWICK